MNKTSFRCIAELDSLEMLHATGIVASSSRHSHETLTLGIIEQGAALLTHKGEPHSIASDCIVVINPDDAHACHPENSLGYSQRIMYPSVALLEQATHELAARSQLIPLFQQPIIEDKTLLQQMQQLFRTLETSTCVLEQETQLLQTLISLISAHAKIPPVQTQPVYSEPQAVRQIREYLEANYVENPSLSQLAALTHLSPFHLSRVFYQAVGLPPHLYLTQVRVSRAKKLLAQGWAIAQVAQAVGFAHQSHLHRHFKKMLGVTPKQYQNSKNVQD